MTTLLELALLLMALELVGLFSGYTIHQKNANALSALAHLGGFLATLSMMLNGWTVRVYPYMFTLFRYENLQIYIPLAVLAKCMQKCRGSKQPRWPFLTCLLGIPLIYNLNSSQRVLMCAQRVCAPACSVFCR